MKRLILFIAVAFLSAGCAGIFLSPSDVANKVKLGMTVAEFKRLTSAQTVEIDSMTPYGTVYRIDTHNIGLPDYVTRVTLYHFDANERLVEVKTRDLLPPFMPGFSPSFEPLQAD